MYAFCTDNIKSFSFRPSKSSRRKGECRARECPASSHLAQHRPRAQTPPASATWLKCSCAHPATLRGNCFQTNIFGKKTPPNLLLLSSLSLQTVTNTSAHSTLLACCHTARPQEREMPSAALQRHCSVPTASLSCHPLSFCHFMFVTLISPASPRNSSLLP